MGARYTVGFARFSIVLDWVKWVQCGAQRTLKHRVARGRARIAHSETFVQLLYCSVLLLHNSVQSGTIDTVMFCLVLLGTGSDKKRYKAKQSSATVYNAKPPRPDPTPYPYYYNTFPHRKICAMNFVGRCSPLVRNPPCWTTLPHWLQRSTFCLEKPL